MSRNIISIPGGVSTLGILRQELDRIEQITGDRPADWLGEIYDMDIGEFFTPYGFDFEGFAMHLSFHADNYIDFIDEHVKDLTIDFLS